VGNTSAGTGVKPLDNAVSPDGLNHGRRSLLRLGRERIQLLEFT
jgi:hypothetical protein